MANESKTSSAPHEKIGFGHRRREKGESFSLVCLDAPVKHQRKTWFDNKQRKVLKPADGWLLVRYPLPTRFVFGGVGGTITAPRGVCVCEQGVPMLRCVPMSQV